MEQPVAYLQFAVSSAVSRNLGLCLDLVVQDFEIARAGPTAVQIDTRVVQQWTLLPETYPKHT